MIEEFHEDIEGRLVCLLCNNPEMIAEAQALVSPCAMENLGHRLAYQSIISMCEAGHPLEPGTLIRQLTEDQTIERVGGSRRVAEYFCEYVLGAALPYYASKILDAHARRRVTWMSMEMMELAKDESLTSDELMDVVERKVADFAQGNSYHQDAITSEAAIKIAMEKIRTQKSGLRGLATGLTDLDAKLKGLQPSRVYIIAGVPGCGKSALATNLAYHAATVGRVLYYSLEMPANEIALRQVAAWSRVESNRIQDGREAIARPEVQEAVRHVAESRVIYHDDGLQTAESIRTWARLYARQPEGLAMLVLDYVQLVGSSKGAQHRNREEAVAHISRQMKLLAMELAIPVVVCAQLNRESLRREDHVPRLGELRESGALEQDADVILFVHRPSMFSSGANMLDATLFVAKNRGGPTGQIRVAFHAGQYRFADVHQDGTEEPIY